MKKCIFCAGNRLYVKSQTQYYCTVCKRTWSEQKYQRDCTIIEAFIHDESILACSQKYTLSYNTTKEIYHKIRLLLLEHSQDVYAKQEASFSQYDEYYYLPKRKQKTTHHILDAIGIFGMLYEPNLIYTLLLPDQFSATKRLMQHDTMELVEHEEFAHYLQWHKVAHVEHFEHKLEKFWEYFERFMCHFKGIKKENIIYYLKEAEFKFNYSSENQKKIILDYWKKNM